MDDGHVSVWHKCMAAVKTINMMILMTESVYILENIQKGLGFFTVISQALGVIIAII